MNIGVLQSAAFMMEGLHDADYSKCIEAYGLGCIEMVTELVEYAPKAHELFEVWYAKNSDSCPGVYDYEVSSPFGDWFGKYLIEHEEVPSKTVAEQYLIRLADQFFNQGEVKMWKQREQNRINSGEYKAIAIPGDDVNRFLHHSLDGTDRVAYTKSSDKGEADLQTVTTMEAYCQKFGLSQPVVAAAPVAAVPVGNQFAEAGPHSEAAAALGTCCV